jgi:carbamoyl-phosphate synthase large subunit
MADPTLTTQMKSVGEVMAIGRTFKESLQKALRGLEIGVSGLYGGRWGGAREIRERDEIERKLISPCAERIFYIRHAFRAGFSPEEINKLTHIDPWFLQQIKEIVDMEDALVKAGSLEKLSSA